MHHRRACCRTRARTEHQWCVLGHWWRRRPLDLGARCRRQAQTHGPDTTIGSRERAGRAGAHRWTACPCSSRHRAAFIKPYHHGATPRSWGDSHATGHAARLKGRVGPHRTDRRRPGVFERSFINPPLRAAQQGQRHRRRHGRQHQPRALQQVPEAAPFFRQGPWRDA